MIILTYKTLLVILEYNNNLVNNPKFDIGPVIRETRKKLLENQHHNVERINIILTEQQKHVENIARKERK